MGDVTDSDTGVPGAAPPAPCPAGSVRLPPDLGSARHARELLREVLSSADRLDCLDAAELACTELVTNAVLHAHTDVEVTIEIADAVRVAVRDFNPTPPLQRHYDVQATTGRGLALVAAVSDGYGVEHLGAEGKSIWFTVGTPRPDRSEQEVLAAWDAIDWDTGPRPDDAVATAGATAIRLVGLPPTLWLAALQHEDALLRELAFYRSRHPVAVDIAAADRVRAVLSGAVIAVVEAAQRGGEAVSPLPQGHPSPLPPVPAPFDVVIAGDQDIGKDAAALQDALDVAEDLAARGRLLARPGLPEIIAVRDWACEQIQAQLAGVEPAPWMGTDDTHFLTEVDVRAARQLDAFTASVTRSERCIVAADDGNRIVAVSEPLARTLGWRVDDLVGRRIVALIPPHLREAHGAGFTRHLTTGEAHVLGLPLVLPVLRHDGTEVSCTFLIDQLQPVPGRFLYVASIDPVVPEPEVEPSSS
jgi:PAS domain S-box-containing protein